MIGNYLIVAVVFGIGLSFVASIHYFWLRDEFKEDAAPSAPATKERGRAASPAGPAPRPKARGETSTQVLAAAALEQRPGIMNERRQPVKFAALRTRSCNTTNT